jgi:RNA polymerase sigma-70 factor (ECF subfamily)
LKPQAFINPENLLDELQSKNEAALSYLYDNYSGALYGVLLKILKEPELCQDVLQESFVKIWNNIDLYNPSKGALYTWMLNIVRNNAIDYIRSKRHKNQQQNQGIDNFVYALQSNQNFNPQHIGLNELIKTLPAEQQQIVQLSYFEGYTQQEISEEFDIPLGTVKSRGRSALQKLKKLFNR